MANGQERAVALAVVFIALPMGTVALRFWAKSIMKGRIRNDDYMILLALAFTVGTGLCQLLAASIGNLGQHITYGSSGIPNQLGKLVLYFKVQYGFEILAQLAIVCAKLSLILLYRRIFVGPVFKRLTWIIGTLIVVWHGAFIFAFIFQCTPISTVWNLTASNPKCVDRIALWKTYAISDILTDTMVLSMPIPATWDLQMGKKQKLAVSGIFLLGTIVIASGITRTVYFFQIAKEPLTDTTYSAAPTWYWSFIETSLGTVCACLPVLRPIFVNVSLESFLGRLRSSFFVTHKSSKIEESSDDNTPPSSSLGFTPRGAYPGDGHVERGVGTIVSAHESYADDLPLVNITSSQERPLKAGEILVRSELR